MTDVRFSSSTRRRLAGALVVAAALLPTLVQSYDANAESVRLRGRARVLSLMTTDPTVLINATWAEMPSSPDILNLGKRATGSLERCLSDNANAGIRRTCAEMIHAIGDRKALPALRGATADWDAGVRNEVIRGLGSMPSKKNFPVLEKLYKRRDETHYNKLAILWALGQTSDKRAVRLLRAEVRRKPKKKDPEHRVAAFGALWSSRHLMARGTLVLDVTRSLKSDHDPLVRAAVGVAAELRARRHVAALVPLMEHQDAEIRNKAVYALGKIGDRTATRALLGHLPKVREARMLNNLAFALERLDPKAFYPAVQKLIVHKQAIIRLNASYVVGDVKRPEGLSMLKKALKDPSDFVRTSAVVAIGKLDTKDGISALERFTDDPNLTIRQEAIYAINTLSQGKKSDLIYDKLFASKVAKKSRNGPLRRRAAIELGKLGDKRVRKYLLECYEAYRCSEWQIDGFLRQDKHPSTPGRVLLNWVRGRSDLTGLVGELKPAGTYDMARAGFDTALAQNNRYAAYRAADVLGDLGKTSGVKTLEPVLRSRNTWLRSHVSVALARLGHKRAVDVIVADIDNLPVEWLPSFVRVVSQIEEPKVQSGLTGALESRLKDKDDNVALASAAILLAWNPEKRFFTFLDALSSNSVEKKEVATRYLRQNDHKKLTWVMRRALARETRPYTRDRLRALLDER